MTRSLFIVFTALVVGTGCAASSEDPSSEEMTDVSQPTLFRSGLGADGDSCTVRIKPDGTKVPGTEKDGECCSNTDSNDCVIILKPFPGAFVTRW